MQYIVLDLEWNQPLNYQSRAFRLYGDRLRFELIQIGAVRLNASLEIEDTISLPIHPVCYPTIHPRIRTMTGLTQELLDESPMFEEAMDQFVTWCGENYVLLTWGCDDISVLKQNMDFFDVHPELPEMYDVQLLFRKEKQLDNRLNLKAAVELMGIPEEENLTFHNACHDAYYTALIFQALEHPDEVLEFRETARPLAPVQAHVTRGDLFESVASALQSEQARMPRCAVCARPCTPDGSYVMVAADRYQSLARCSRHGQMLVTLSLQLTGDMCSMKVRADRATRANIAYVHTKRLQEEARRREGRMPDAELLLRRHSDSTREVLVP